MDKPGSAVRLSAAVKEGGLFVDRFSKVSLCLYIPAEAQKVTLNFEIFRFFSKFAEQSGLVLSRIIISQIKQCINDFRLYSL